MSDGWGEAIRRDGDRVSLWWQNLHVGPYGGVQRATVPVELTSPATGRMVGASALLDTGADFTQATTALLADLGVRPQDCEGEVTSFNSSAAITFRCPIDLVIAETYTIRFHAMAFRDWGALNRDTEQKLLLGSNDVLRFLKVTLDYGETILEPREPGGTVFEQPHDILEPAA